jgi:pyridoxine kinase
MIVSSYVAASRVGGGIAPFVLAPMKIDPVVFPTVLLGRHPGWGAPGGGAVSGDMLNGMVEGAAANNLLPLTDAFATGYFASVEQVGVAASAIDRLRTTPHKQAHSSARARSIVLVDPIMGDDLRGQYVREDVAEAITRELVPRADIIAPNLWEFRRLLDLGDEPLAAAGIAHLARQKGGAWLVSSVRDGDRIGAVYADANEAWFASAPFIDGETPNGTGDLLTLVFLGRLVAGADPSLALSQAVGATHAVIARARAWSAPELPLAACGDLFTDPPAAGLQRLDP